MQSHAMTPSVLKKALLSMIISSALLSVYGCSTTSTSAQWAEASDQPGEWSTSDDSQKQWSQKVNELPVELHGALPELSQVVTAAMIPNAVTTSAVAAVNDDGVSLLATPRVVLYIDGKEIPERADFCALSKQYRPAPSVDNKIALRVALCDGPRIVSYARKYVNADGFQAKNLGKDVASLESSLVGALYPPINILDADE